MIEISAEGETLVQYRSLDGAGNASATDIAAEVRKAIEQIERERRGRGFGDEGDY